MKYRDLRDFIAQLESRGEQEIPAEEIGRLVMDGLKNLDAVAYVRFASVYRDFREAKDFETFVGELSEGKAGVAADD